MDTLQAIAPPSAVPLFNATDLSNWKTREGGAAGWRVEDGVIHVEARTGDILTEQLLGDHFLHLEFRCPDMPEAPGQAKGNSGVFLQGRYEVQVLDSYGWEVPGMGDCGAVYDQFAPLLNACKPPMEWQTYDIVFRAARVADGQVTEPVRMTVFHNGSIIHNNIQLPGITGGSLDENEGEPGPLLLQDHGNSVAYRNIWALPLALSGSDTYDPR